MILGDIRMGYAASVINKSAGEHNCDLILMATHGYGGWQRLPGSATSAVLHGTTCSVFKCSVPLGGD